MAEEATVAKATRKKFCSKVYVNKDGTESRHAGPDVVQLEFRYYGIDGKLNGEKTVFRLNEIGKGCARACAWHGGAQKIGDEGNKATTWEEARESHETMIERLNGDEWVKPGEGAGPKTGVLILAIARACVKAGTWDADADGSPTENKERMEANRVKVSTKEGRDGAMANKDIEAEFKQLQLEASTKRAADAAAQAPGSKEGLEGF
ncbi:hypothetical protein LCGC14_0389780 [marine sediment metagenome]|uniref:Uncharacterized protein n=1 Tax=marine sediment metagenome TaxID=412755 RepID=A0A0F9VM43_9ZZZZ